MRKVVNFNTKWAFTKLAESVPTEIDNRWEFVNLPHTWNGIDGQDGGNDYYRGRAYYAKPLNKSDLPKADKYYLEINGANSSADVYLNGKHLAHHDGGYSTWRVDITDMEEKNILVIAVDNSENDRVYPQMADFTFYGGLYRDVNIICVPSSHFELEYFGGKGIAVTPEIKGNDAEITVDAYLANSKVGQTVRYTVKNAEGEIAVSTEVADTKAVLNIENVHRWHGRRDPYLYTAEIELIDNGEVLDKVSARFGCRTFEIDPDKGFILNGEEYPLRGVCRHQDRENIGNALLKSHHIEDMDLICEVGATTIRLAHYQHDQFFYDLCDERGMVVWAEIPYISKHMPNGRENTISQMKELIIQNYNHPSIVVWGLSNEITIADFTPDQIDNHYVLNDLVHQMDKTRLTTLACESHCGKDYELVSLADTVSYNLYFGWYDGDISMNGPWMDDLHRMYPTLPVGCSEYGADARICWHNSNPTQGDYSEEYQAKYHEGLIKQFYTRKYMWATHVWNMFDFAVDARNFGGKAGWNYKGLVTADRKVRKDAFYAHKAWLSEEKFVHICSKRYVDRAENTTRVTVYSNCPEVELFANGESVGKQKAEDHFFYFDVPNVGETKLKAVAGDCTDESFIRKVDKINMDYVLKENAAILNWFDIDSPEGYFSLNDVVGEILANKKGAEVLKEFIQSFKGLEFFGIAVGDEMFKKMNSYTVVRFANRFGAERSITKEQLLELNRRLNKIRK